MSRFCTKCGAQLEEGARFCTRCGQLVEPITPSVSENDMTQAYDFTDPAGTAAYTPVSDAPNEPADNTMSPAGDVTEPSWNPDLPSGDPNWNPDPTGPAPTVNAQEPGAGYTQVRPAAGPYGQPQGYPGGKPYVPQPEKKSHKGLVIGLVCAFLAIIVGVVLYFVLANRTKTVELDNYITVNYAGYDGYGTAEVTFDQSRFLQENADKFKNTKAYSKEQAAASLASDAAWWAKLDKTSGLKNGDELQLTWSLDETTSSTITELYGVKVSATDKKVTVSGLTEVAQFDPFDSLTVKFEGNDGSGYVLFEQAMDDYYWEMGFAVDGKEDGLSNGDTVTVNVEIYDIDSFVQNYGKAPSQTSKTYTVEGLGEITTFDPFDYITWTIDGVSPEAELSIDFTEDAPDVMYALYPEDWYYYDLKNGDEITIKLSEMYTDEDLASYYGMIPSTRTKTITIEGLDTYVSELSQIPESTLTAMQDVAKTAIDQQAAGFSSDVKLDSADYQGMYMLTPKNADQYYYQRNYVYLVYKNTVSADGGTAEYYYYVAFENLILKADSTCEVDLTDYDEPYSSVTIDSYWFSGYESLEAFKESCIDYNAESYNYVTNME